MNKRISIPKKLRFEVFKRDKFTCQYCGAKAPDAVLHCDHIHPVAEGGKNDILNLITSCVDCNLGKGKRLLSDDSVVVKQREQLEALAERREQLDMLLEWREALSDADSHEVDRVEEYWSKNFGGYLLTQNGKDQLRKLIKKFGVDAIVSAIEAARDTYGFDPEAPESASFAFSKLGGIANNQKLYEEAPWMKDVHYAGGILRKRLHYYNKEQAIELLTELAELGYDGEDLKYLALNVKNWTQFRNSAEQWKEDRAGNWNDGGES